MKIVITGGHHTSALPVIKKIREQKPDAKIIWFGHKYSAKNDKNESLEFKDISRLGIPFYELHAGKLYKTFDPIRLAKIPYGFFQALFLLLKLRPKVILSFGGYLAAPVVLAGFFLRIPTVTHEQTVVVGWATRLISKFAKKVLISWDQTTEYLPNVPKRKIVKTGIPLRKEIFTQKSNNFELNPNLPTMYLTAGKQGSHVINSEINKALPSLLKMCNLIHQCGDNSFFNDHDKLQQTYVDFKKSYTKSDLEFKQDFGAYVLKKFVFADEIGEAFTKSDFILCRSGAHTTYEILFLQKPAIMIPIPWVSHNEQYKNAKVVQDAGLGIILDEKDLNSVKLIKSVKEIIENLENYKLNEIFDKSIFQVDSAQLIVDEVFKYIK